MNHYMQVAVINDKPYVPVLELINLLSVHKNKTDIEKLIIQLNTLLEKK